MAEIHGGIDPLHPVVKIFENKISELETWTYPTNVDKFFGCRDPGPPIYLYTLINGQEVLYVGITRNLILRFKKHRRKSWWTRVENVVIGRIDCHYHDGYPCSVVELDNAARRIESWYIDIIKPTEMLKISRVD